jgi:Ca2+-binding RTX toxin-like protein
LNRLKAAKATTRSTAWAAPTVQTTSRSKAGVVVNLATGTASDGYGGTDTLSGIENVRGSTFNDTLTGDANANWLEGGVGNDT